jgi:excisionase family DNA binding protein
MPNLPTRYSITKAAVFLGLSEGYLYRLIARGVLPSFTINGRRYIDGDVLREFKQRRSEPVPC